MLINEWTNQKSNQIKGYKPINANGKTCSEHCRIDYYQNTESESTWTVPMLREHCMGCKGAAGVEKMVGPSCRLILRFTIVGGSHVVLPKVGRVWTRTVAAPMPVPELQGKHAAGKVGSYLNYIIISCSISAFCSTHSNVVTREVRESNCQRWTLACNGSVVVTNHDFESGRTGSNPEWTPIYYKASINAQGSSEPSSLRGSTSVPEQLNIKAVTGSCKLIDGCSLALCSATVSVVSADIIMPQE